MRKYQKAAVVLAMLGSTGFLGAGVSHGAEEPQAKLTNNQTETCGNESSEGLINISRIHINVLSLGSPQDTSHTTTCTNQYSEAGK